MGIFRYDSDFMQGISKVVDLAWLNILCVLCSIPVFTFGAAVSAKYYVAMKIERGQAPVVTSTFFRAFKDNFRQDVKATMIMILVYAFFAADWYIIIKSNGGIQVIFTGMLAIFSVMFMIITFCIFPMISRFEMKTFDAFRNALVFGIIHLPRVLLGIILAVLPYIIGIWYFKWAWLIWLFAACVMLYYNSRFFIKSFDKLEERTFGVKKSDEESEDVNELSDEESSQEIREDSEEESSENSKDDESSENSKEEESSENSKDDEPSEEKEAEEVEE